MSDLISRNQLLKVLSEAEDNYRAEHHDCVMDDDPFSDGILSAMFSVFQIVKLQPTAYSVDKAVEGLKEMKMIYFLTIGNTGDEKTDFAYENVGNALDKAIEIVKQSGVYEAEQN